MTALFRRFSGSWPVQFSRYQLLRTSTLGAPRSRRYSSGLLVDRHWWHHIMHEHVAGRLQPVLQSLPRVVVTSVPFHLAD